MQIDMESTWSDSDRLTGHLKNEDFFDARFSSASLFQPASRKTIRGIR